MGTIDSARSDFSKVLLVACDQSYDPSTAEAQQGMVLAPFFDSGEQPNRFIPDEASAAMPAAWGDLLGGWTVSERIFIPETGFGATIFAKTGANGQIDYIVAMQGTRGSNIQDWSGNLVYGWDKWSHATGGESLINRLVELATAGNVGKIHFTGQSMGGALAEYALYDYAIARGGAFDTTKVTLTTFNGLGGIAALQKERNDPINNFNTNAGLLRTVDTAHFWITNDVVSRLGGGHLNGSENEHELKFMQTTAEGFVWRREDLTPLALDPFTGHRLESGFYGGFYQASRTDPFGERRNDFPIDFTGAIQKEVSILHVQNLARAGTYIAWLSNQDGALPTKTEAWARLIAALTIGMASGPREEVQQLVNAIGDSAYDFGLLNSKADRAVFKSFSAKFLPTLANSPTGGLTQVAARLLALMAETHGQSATVDLPDEFRQELERKVAAANTAGTALAFDPVEVASQIHGFAVSATGKAKSSALLVGGVALGLAGVITALPSIAVSAKTAAISALFDLSRTLVDDASAYIQEALRVVALTLREGLNISTDTFSRGMVDAAEAIMSAVTEGSRYVTDTQTYLEQTENSASSGLTSVAKSLANAYGDMVLKHADVFAWGEQVTFAVLNGIAKGLTSIFDSVSTPGSATRLSLQFKAEFEDALEILESAGQTIVITQGRPQNPFDDPAFDPDASLVAVGTVKEGQVKALTVFLPYEAQEGGQHISLQLAGSAAGKPKVLLDADEIDLGDDGEFDLLISEGSRSISFGIWAQEDVDIDETLSLSATLVDAEGNATHVIHLELNLALDAIDEVPLTGGREIRGDWAPKLFVDPDTGGTFFRFDELGNIERDPGVANTTGFQEPDVKLDGSPGPDHIVTGDYEEVAYGFEGDDSITGSEMRGSIFFGGAGNDWIEALGYSEHVADYFEFAHLGRIVKLGEDKIYGGAGDDVIWGESSATAEALYDPAVTPTGLLGDWTSGGSGADKIYGGAGDDVLMGGVGEDLLVGGAGVDVLLGDDHYSVGMPGNFWRVLHPNLGDSTPGYGGFELGLFPVVNATLAFPDMVFPQTGDPEFTYYKNGGAADVLIGGAGKDILIGQLGDDTLYGGEDDDILAGWEGADQLIGGAGNDLMAGDFGRYEQVNQRAVDAAQLVRAGVLGSSAAFGTPVDQIGNDFLDGGAGNDTLFGEGGNDVVIGGEGNDTLYGDASYLPADLHGADILDGGAGDDFLDGGGRDDQLYGGAGMDNLLGGDGNDLLDGGTGNDALAGGAGDDTLEGGDGADILSGGDGNDVLRGGEGNDELDGGAGDDVLIAGEGENRLEGGSGNDTLFGGSGGDTLLGGAGDDLIDGGGGIDLVRGGEGNDTYVLNVGYGRDSIEDSEGKSTLSFGAGILAENLNATLNSATLTATISYGAAGDAVDLSLGNFQLGSIQFADGVTWGRKEFLKFLPALVSQGSAANETLTGHEALRNDLRGLGGKDTINGSSNDDTLAGGEGADILEGAGGSDRYFFSADESGVDLISDSELSARAYLDRFYGDLGIADWEFRAQYGDQYQALVEGEGTFRAYFNTLEDAIATYPDATITFVEPLPAAAPLVRRDDTAALESLIQAGVVSKDVVEFGPGVTLSDLTLTISVKGQVADQHPEQPWYGGGTLSVSWGDAGFNVEVPDVNFGFVGANLLTDGVFDPNEPAGAWRGYRLGEGIEAFEFADGGTFTLEEILQHASVVVRNGYNFLRGSGNQVIDRTWNSIVFEPGIETSEVQVTRDGTDLLITLTDGSAQGRIVDWYADPGTVPQIALRFADGTEFDSDTVTRLGLTQYGTEDFDFLQADETFASALYGLGGGDFLFGFGGNDLLDGGEGRDFLQGGSGNDIYVFGSGYGEDEISEDPDDGGGGTADVVRFTPGVFPDDIAIDRDYGNLVLTVNGGDDILTVFGWFAAPNGSVERFEFADGTVWDAAFVETQLPDADPATEEDDLLLGTTGDDVLLGLGGNDEIAGFAGDDILDGGGGDEYIEGGPGYDILRGGEGTDDVVDWQDASLLDAGAGDDYIYHEGGSFIIGAAGDDWIDTYGPGSVIAFNLGDGADTIYVFDSFTLSMGGGLTPADLSLNQDGTDLVLSISPVDSVRLTRQFEADPQAWPQITLQLFGSVHLYDFNAVIEAFQGALAADPLLDRFELDGVLQAHQTAFSETQALGGAIAWQYATAGNTGGLTTTQIRSVLADSGFGVTTQSISLESGNPAPTVANPIADQNAAEDSEFIFTVPAETFSDAGDTLTFTTTLESGDALPSWLNFDPVTHAFLGTPGNDDVGTLSVRVTATDSAGLSVSDIFDIVVSNTNDAPVAADDTGAAGEDGGPVALPGAALLANDTDVDVGDTKAIISVSGVSAAGAQISLVGGNVVYDIGGLFQTLGLGALASDTFTYTMADAAGATSTAAVSMTIIGANDAPQLVHAAADPSGNQNAPLTFQLPQEMFADVDTGDNLTLSATLADGAELPAWLAFDPANGSFSGIPSEFDVGNLDIRVTATDDAGAVAADRFTLSVSDASIINETHLGTRRRDVIVTGFANDLIDAGRGDDLVRAGAGRDIVFGGKGDDRISGEAGNDRLYGGKGADRIEGGLGNDLLYGGKGSDVLQGGAGSDLLSGGDGHDQLAGGEGGNLLIGGQGHDVITGGSGAELFLLNLEDGKDTLHLSGAALAGNEDTLSLGGGIGVNDISLKRDRGDLIVGARDDERAQITLKDWYRDAGEHQTVAALQFFEGGTATLYDFKALVVRFDAETQGRHSTRRWSAAQALPAVQLASGAEPVGGEIAWEYAMNGAVLGDEPLADEDAEERATLPGGDWDKPPVLPAPDTRPGGSKGEHDNERDDHRSKERRDSVAGLLEAYLAQKPRYDFESLALELERWDRDSHKSSAHVIAQRWAAVARYSSWVGEHGDDEGRYGAGGWRLFDRGLFEAGALGGGFGYGGSTELSRHAASLQTLKGLGEGFQKLGT